MKLIAEFVLAVALLIGVHILAALFHANVTAMISGVVCYLWAHMLIENSNR